MATTTVTKHWKPGDSVRAILVAAIALALLLLAGNQLLSQLSRIPANSHFKQQQARFSDDEQAQAALCDSTERYARIPPQRRGEQEWRRLASTELLLRQYTHDPQTREQQHAAIQSALTASLARAPVQPLAWAYLANLRLPPAGDCAQAMAALQQSYRVAPIEPNLLTYRLELATHCPRHWNTTLLKRLRTDVQSVYLGPPKHGIPQAIITWVSNQHRRATLIRQLLRDQPQALAQFEQQLKSS